MTNSQHTHTHAHTCTHVRRMCLHVGVGTSTETSRNLTALLLQLIFNPFCLIPNPHITLPCAAFVCLWHKPAKCVVFSTRCKTNEQHCLMMTIIRCDNANERAAGGPRRAPRARIGTEKATEKIEGEKKRERTGGTARPNRRPALPVCTGPKREWQSNKICMPMIYGQLTQQ